MKILYLTNIPSPYRVDFFNELGRQCDLTVLFEGRTENHRYDNWCKYNSENFAAIYLNKSKLFRKTICWDVIGFLTTSYDCIVIGGYNTLTFIYAMQYLKSKGIPYVISIDGGLIKKESALKKKVKTLLLSSASYWLSTSDVADGYLKYYGAREANIYRYHFTSLKEGDIESARNLVEKKNNIKRELGFQNKKIILSIGRFNLQGGYGKGYDVLMHVAEKLKKENIGIYIVGDEPTDEFIKWKKEKDLMNVHFIGYVDSNSIKKYYAAADLFILLTRSDVWGLVINEALSFGLPTITTDKCVAGLELIRDGYNGYIVPVDEVDKTTEHIRTILYDSNIDVIKKNSVESIRDYTVEYMANQHLGIFKEIKWRQQEQKQHKATI